MSRSLEHTKAAPPLSTTAKTSILQSVRPASKNARHPPSKKSQNTPKASPSAKTRLRGARKPSASKRSLRSHTTPDAGAPIAQIQPTEAWLAMPCVSSWRREKNNKTARSQFDGHGNGKQNPRCAAPHPPAFNPLHRDGREDSPDDGLASQQYQGCSSDRAAPGSSNQNSSSIKWQPRL